MKYDNMTLKEVAKIAQPYDPASHSRDYFEEKIRKNPQLESDFQQQFTEYYRKIAEEKGLFFITNWYMDRRVNSSKTEIKLELCGPNKLPVISIY
jgi:hypothetical protein